MNQVDPSIEYRPLFEETLQRVNLAVSDPSGNSVRHYEKCAKFFSIVDGIRSHSKDESTKVGAVALANDYTVLAMGYNGFPRKVRELGERKIRPEKYYWFSHAEENLVAQAARIGVSLNGSTVLVSPLYPCTTCSRMLIQAGVRQVLARSAEDEAQQRWLDDALRSFAMLEEAGVEVVLYSQGSSSFERVFRYSKFVSKPL